MTRHRQLITVVVVLFLGAATMTTAAPPRLEPRAPVIKPQHTQLRPAHRTDVIRVKFRDDLPVRLAGAALTDLGTGALTPAADLLDEVAGGQWSRLSSETDAKLQQMRDEAQGTLGKAIADFRTWYHLFLPEGADAEEVIDAFNALACVELAEPLPIAIPARPPSNLASAQYYLNPGPVGVNAFATWEHLNTRGNHAFVVDIEYAYNAQHQDLPSVTPIGAPGDPFVTQAEIDHGTASLGVIGAVDNGFGTTGIAPDAGLGFNSARQLGGIVNIANSILSVASFTGAGTIILVELQVAGPNVGGTSPCVGAGCQHGFVPVEWGLAEYNAIVTAVGTGHVVVEPAGNGSQDLDSSSYTTGNGGHWPFTLDSGAIIVGAGSAPPGALGGSDVDRSRMCCSNYGSRVDVQAWGERVRTLGYGDGYSLEGQNWWVTNTFAGTSSASAIVAGAAALMQSAFIQDQIDNPPFPPMPPVPMAPTALRAALAASGSAQQAGTFPASQNIGPRPDVAFGIASVIGGCLPLWNTGIGNPGLGVQNPATAEPVLALEVYDDGGGDDLYAGGQFTSASGSPASIARWDGSSWSSVGTPIGSVNALLAFDDGNGPALFTGVNGALLKWDGSSWTTVGSVPGGGVVALAEHDDGNGAALYVGGFFTSIGGVSASNIAKWDGTSFSALGSGTTQPVLSLASYDDSGGADLYAGGSFPTAGGVTVNHVGRWDGTSWSALGSGRTGQVNVLEVYDDGGGPALYAGGFFTIPTENENNIAK
ncbi:MAG: S8 family serine peptidase, partial [Planctomycetota bacterium]